MSAVKPSAPFSRLRFAVAVLIGVYPVITGLLYVVLPLTEVWAIWERTLVIAPIMVTVMVFGLIPAIQRRLAFWLHAPAR